MTRRTEKRQGTQAGSEATGTLDDVLTPLITGMKATRAHLLEWVQAQRLVALQEVSAAEVQAVQRPRNRGRSHAVIATACANASAGVRQPSVCRGRPFSSAAISSRRA